MTTKRTSFAITLPHSGAIEQRDDKWVARSNEYGITVCGDTYDDARRRIDSATYVLLRRLLRGGLGRLEARLKSRGVPYSIQVEPPQRKSFAFSEMVREELHSTLEGELQPTGV